MTVDQKLLKPFKKVSIRDLNEHKVEDNSMVWIQGTVKNCKTDFVHIEDAENPGFIIRITGGDLGQFQVGKYYQILGEFLRNEIRAVKVVEIELPILKEMWPLELKDFQRA